MMITKFQAEKIATAVNAIRPDWDISGITTALGKARTEGEPWQLAIAAFAAAANSDNRTPAVIALPGHHWRPARLNATPTPRPPRPLRRPPHPPGRPRAPSATHPPPPPPPRPPGALHRTRPPRLPRPELPRLPSRRPRQRHPHPPPPAPRTPRPRTRRRKGLTHGQRAHPDRHRQPHR